jgi:outer membrane protein
VPQALADWRPTVEAGAGGGQSVSGPVGDADLRVVQPIYRGLGSLFQEPPRTSSRVEQAKKLVRAQRGQLLAAEQGALLGAATAYIDVVRAQKVLEFSTAYQQLSAERGRIDAAPLRRGRADAAPSHADRSPARRRYGPAAAGRARPGHGA